MSDRGGDQQQVHLLPRDGGEARALGHFDQGAGSPVWAPDGGSLLVLGTVLADPDQRPGGSGIDRGASGAEVCWRLPYTADGVGWLLGRTVHLFRLDVASGTHTQLTQGAFDVLAAAPSPDGERIAFIRTRTGRFAHCTDLWICNADGGDARCLETGLANAIAPAWSPDGRWIAIGGAVREGDGQTGLWLVDVASGKAEPLGEGDLEVADPETLHWSADGQTVHLLEAERGRHRLIAVAVPGGAVCTLFDSDRQVGALVRAKQRWFYTVDAPDRPSDVGSCDAGGGDDQAVSDLNPWWRERQPVQVTSRTFRVPDGAGGTEEIHGWLLRGAHAQGAQPLLDEAHGGPASYALLGYDTAVYRQVLCAQGWTVLLLNAVGSSGYGRDFCERLAGHWGELDFPQHQAAIAQLREEGLVGDRVAMTGKSYGGVLTAWAVGHDDGLAAAVVMSPVGNLETHYGTLDGGYYADPLYLGMQPAFDRAKARQHSPLQWIERATVPTLFLQGKDDERTPVCQTEELFTSLTRAGNTPTEMVLYPGENHSFLGEGKPSVRADAAARVVEWLGRQHAPQPAQQN